MQVINWTAVEQHRARNAIYPGEGVRFTDTDWRLYSTAFKTPAQAGDQLYLELSPDARGGEEAIAWFDAFSIRAIGPEQQQVLDATAQADQTLYSALVQIRYDIGSRCDMLRWKARDAREAGAISAADAQTIATAADGVSAELEKLVSRWQERHTQMFASPTPITRLSADELAGRTEQVTGIAREAEEDLGAARQRFEATLADQEQALRKAAADFTLAPQVASEVTPEALRDRFHRIVSWHGYMDDAAYVHRAMWSLPATIVQGYLWREDKWPLREQFFEVNAPRTLPYVERVLAEGWPDLTAFRANVEREMAALGARVGFRGFELDEPSIVDAQLATDEGYAAFREYVKAKYSADQRRDLGIENLEGWTVPEKAETDADRVAWMEWQQFKISVMTGRLHEAQEFIKSQQGEPVLLPVIQQFLPSEPQKASWPAVSGALDWVAMDPYNGGSPAEAFEMDLLRSNAMGPVYLVVGTCYDPTAGRFHKDMCISLGHADGLWVWCWVYMAKYRAPGFLRNGWERQYRHLWKPGMWEAAQEVFSKIQVAEPYLVHTESAAPTAVVFSERTGILDSGEKPGNDLIRQFHITQGLYQALQQSHIATEAVFAESLTPERLSGRRVLLLADARCLTDEQIGLVRDWVRGGGSLIAMGPVSLLDQWGRAREDYALADVFGATYRGTIDTPAAVVPGEALRDIAPDLPAQIDLPPDREADRVEPTTAEVIATCADGQPAMLRNSFGAGA
ncbi:MAG TPA: hypothetical protein VM283_06560, partial [Armatimonadota bacterium]|nr:hypothetical protein [Armatimonadota bacterium]